MCLQKFVRFNLEAPCMRTGCILVLLVYICNATGFPIVLVASAGSRTKGPSHLSHAFGAARRCKSPIASPDIQDPIGSDRDVDDARDRRSLLPVSRLVSSLYRPLFISLDTPANSHSCMYRERIELFRFSACQESLSPSSRSRKHPTLKRDCRTLPR